MPNAIPSSDLGQCHGVEKFPKAGKVAMAPAFEMHVLTLIAPPG